MPAVLHWAAPGFFWLLPLVPGWLFLAIGRQRRRRGIHFPHLKLAISLSNQPGQKKHYWLLILQALAATCLVLALARPQGGPVREPLPGRGFDILLALDVSDSMLATDIAPNRLGAAKSVLAQFVRNRPQDRFGLAVFAGTCFTVMPLTADHPALLAALAELSPASVDLEGTAIGDGILVGVNRLLENPEGKTPATGIRILIVATDGVNNRGADPAQAARAAAAKGIKIYTLGLGGSGKVPRLEAAASGRLVPSRDIYGRQLFWESPDPALLTDIAALGRGRFFPAADRSGLEEAFARIGQLEPRPSGSFRVSYRQDYFPWLLVLAALFYLLMQVLSKTRFRQLA